MLDYSLDKEQAKNFILNYEKDGENIKVNYANGDEYFVPNTKENEKKLLDRMENQIYHAQSFEPKIKYYRNWLIYDIFFLAWNTTILILNPTALTGICVGVFLLAGIFNSYSYANCKKKLNDLEKNELFLKNKKSINEYLSKGNEHHNEKAMNLVEEEKKEPLNVNDVHNMSYKDIDRILTDIDRDNTFGIDRPKVLAKRYINANNSKNKR